VVQLSDIVTTITPSPDVQPALELRKGRDDKIVDGFGSRSVLPLLCVQNVLDRPRSANISDPQPDQSVGLSPRCSEQYRCGYVNRTGRFVIAPVYKMVKPFYEGLAVVYKEGSGWGVIDPAGNYVVQPTFASIGPFSEGFAAACPSDKNLYQSVYIDRAKTAIELKYNVEQPFPFHSGRAWVRCSVPTGPSLSRDGLFT
jgi:hypothetical protein